MKYPMGYLVYGDPVYYGHTTSFGYARNWVPKRDWVGKNVEFIDELNAIAPIGDYRPQNMSTNWTKGYNQKFRKTKISGNPVVDYYEYYDGSVATSTINPHIYMGNLTMSWNCKNSAFSLLRCSPPPEQTISTTTIIEISAKYNGVDGRIALHFPLQDTIYSSPVLFFAAGWTSFVNIYDGTAKLLSTGKQKSSAKQGFSRETWIFEIIEDKTKFPGTHILIRNSDDMETWHIYNDLLYITGDNLRINCQGSVQCVNAAKIKYDSGFVYPPYVNYLPSYGGQITGSNWTKTASWDSISTDAQYWTTTVSKKAKLSVNDTDDDDYSDRPYVSFSTLSLQNERPILWNISQTHAATIGDAVTTTATTAGTERLVSISYTLKNDFRGSTGNAVLRNMDESTFSTWKRNAWIDIYCGWENSVGKIATAFIDKIERSRDGAKSFGFPSVEISLVDFIAARLAKKQIIDAKMAAGMTVSDWFLYVGNRIGLPTSRLSIDSNVAGLVIPTQKPIPGDVGFAANDGKTWLAHLDEVCNSMGLRWGWDKNADGKFFVDFGSPAYVTGAEVFTLDESDPDVADMIYTIVPTMDSENFKNGIKAVSKNTVSYRVATNDLRKNGVGDDWWMVADDTNSTNANELATTAQKEFNTMQKYLSWTMPLRIDIQPDDYVKCHLVNNVNLTADSIYRVIEHTMDVNSVSNVAESKITALYVQ